MITQGSGGVDIILRLWENNKPFNLQGAEKVTITLESGTHKVKDKSARVVTNGVISATLNPEDIPRAGIYYVQAKVTFKDKGPFYSDINSFPIGKRI